MADPRPTLPHSSPQPHLSQRLRRCLRPRQYLRPWLHPPPRPPSARQRAQWQRLSQALGWPGIPAYMLRDYGEVLSEHKALRFVGEGALFERGRMCL